MNQSKQAWLGLRGERHICIYSPNRRIPQPLGQSMQTRHFFFDFIPSVSGPLHTVHLPLSKPVTELQSHQMVILCSIPTALIIIYQPSRTSIHPCIKTHCYSLLPFSALQSSFFWQDSALPHRADEDYAHTRSLWGYQRLQVIAANQNIQTWPPHSS